ncbi:DUF4249 domain-containing protein [Flavobacterium jejuense]|uniref:DUF4249 domain-containing protein n=1 Tax=Flavobacterium jejuense TaxID=1544455 RepID=A0ABX0ILR6_9FLAO|nr:DUF4249 family protein [Flavobacterium jejuense]NHN24742.1 DUF4249 domain-containing protein [Flavobacterium jejuense]
MVKIIIKISIVIITLITMIACEDVVNVDLDTAAPKLVIDAAIKWEKGTTGNEQTIRLTTTSNFYTNEVPKVTGATVSITDESTVYDFIEDIGTGNYICTNFNPVLNGNYTLTVIYNGQIYNATDKLYPTPDIESVEQTVTTGFGGEENVQVKFFYQDNGAEDNFYLIGFKNSTVSFPEYGVVDDEFFQGNQMFGLYIDDLQANDQLTLSLQGISFRYANYMDKLLNIAGTDGGNPFSTAPATLRGNIVNETNPDNFPYGYFSLGEIDTQDYVIQ